MNRRQIAESRLLHTLQKTREDAVNELSKHVLERKHLEANFAELQHLYNGQLNLMSTWGTVQQQTNEEIHRTITGPLQLENAQLKQGLWVAQAKLEFEKNRNQEIEDNLVLAVQKEFNTERDKAVAKAVAEQKAAFDKQMNEAQAKIQTLEREQAEQVVTFNERLQGAETRVIELEAHGLQLQGIITMQLNNGQQPGNP